MSQMSVATTVAKRSTSGTPRTSLRVVTPDQRAGSAWFPVLCVGLLISGLVAVLGLNTAMAQDSFEVSALEARSASLADSQDSLTHAINARSAPARLADRADELGMVPVGSAAFIDADAGTILGVATAAKKPDRFTVDAAATASAEEDTSADSKKSSKGDKKPSTTSEKKTSGD